MLGEFPYNDFSCTDYTPEYYMSNQSETAAGGSTQGGDSSQSQQNLDANPQKASKRRTSEVWKYFTIKEIEGHGLRVVCKVCEVHYSCESSGGTGHLNRHMQKHLAKEGKETKQSQLAFTSSGVSTFQYSHERNRRELALYIVGAEQPFTFAECPYFEHYVKTALNPAYKKTSRNTSRKDSIKAFLEYRQNIINILENLNSKISLTSDIWTSRNCRSFICVTAHWIDSNWILQKRIIGFQELEYPHTGVHIAQAIENVLQIYKINQKIFSISFDNASNNRTAVQILKNNLRPILDGKLFHNKCACLIINLCVQEGLKIINPQIKKIKDCIMFIHTSGPRKQDYKSLCRQLGQKYKRFIFDVQHGWNSTYKLLQYCYEYRNVLSIFCNERMQHNPITNEEWDISQNLMTFLQPFYDSTKLLSGVYYPTSCHFLNQILLMSCHFAEYRNSPELSQIVSFMESKFKEYWKEIPIVPLLASVMDPRIKLNIVEIALTKYNELMKINSTNYSSEENIFQIVYNSLYQMYSIYAAASGSKRPCSSQHQSSSSSSGRTNKNMLLSLVRKQKQTDFSNATSFNELQFYLQTDFSNLLNEDELDKLDILAWWKTHESTYPVLSAMARDLLTVQISTVASESAFSAGGRILDDYKTRLKEDAVEVLVCLRDWRAAELRLQDKEDYESTSSDETESTA